MQVYQVCHRLLKNTCPTLHQVRREVMHATVVRALTGQRLTVTGSGLSSRHLQADTTGIYRTLSQRRLGGTQGLSQVADEALKREKNPCVIVAAI